MNSTNRLSFSQFGQIIKHYPVPFMCSLILTLILIIQKLGIPFIDRGLQNDLKLGFSCAFLASGAWNFAAYARSYSGFKNHGIAALIALTLIVFAQFSALISFSPTFLYPGLILLLMVAAFILIPHNENSVWLFNLRFAIAIIMSILAASLVGLGLMTITNSMDFLLGLKSGSSFYQLIWIFSLSFVGPVFGLYLMPKDGTEIFKLPDSEDLLARGSIFLINYILTPMLVIYLIILHLYAAKIALTFDLPKGQVALMVLIFSLGLTAFILIARPWVERATRFTRWLLKYWHYLLITPLALLAISVTRRISDYGVTPERYMLVILGVWLFAMLCLPIIRRVQLSSVTIIGSIATILIISSFGPWGAKGFSIINQKNQFIALLERNDLLVDGAFKGDLETPLKLSAEDQTQAHSIVQFLSKYRSIEIIKPIFKNQTEELFKEASPNSRNYQTANNINKYLGLRRNANNLEVIQYVRFNNKKNALINISEYSTYIPRITINTRRSKPIKQRAPDETQVWITDDNIILDTPKGRWEAPIDGLLQQVKKANKTYPNKDMPVLRFNLKGSSGNATLLIHSLNASYKAEERQSLNMDFDLLIK